MTTSRPNRPTQRRQETLLERSLAEFARMRRAWGYARRCEREREHGLSELRDLVTRGELGCPEGLAAYAVREGTPSINWRFGEMLKRLGIRRRPGNARRLDTLGARCAACPTAAECAAWLASGEKLAFERFCPNAAALRQLADAQR